MGSASIEALAQGVIAGQARALARAIRVVDDRSPGHRVLMTALLGKGKGTRVIGITGNPGAGKSTLVDQLVSGFRQQEKRVAVLAVDPTSPFSGGAILGDRIRMQRHFLDEGVFIRSLATRGQLGGVSGSTVDALVVLDAAGFDVILLETVGVGQDELEVAKLADTTCVVAAPGLGDDVQAIKAGILEVADILVVNKADRPGADATARSLELMVSLGHEAYEAGADTVAHHGHQHVAGGTMAPATVDEDADTWTPPILLTQATKGEGIRELLRELDAHGTYLASSEEARRTHAERRLRAMVRGILAEQLQGHLEQALQAQLPAVIAGTMDPYEAADAIVHELFGLPSSTTLAGVP